MLAYKIQRRRIRFRPDEPEPHPDDSDSAPEDGNYDEPWSDIAEVSGPMVRYFGKHDVLQHYRKHNASSHARPSTDHVSLYVTVYPSWHRQLHRAPVLFHALCRKYLIPR